MLIKFGSHKSWSQNKQCETNQIKTSKDYVARLSIQCPLKNWKYIISYILRLVSLMECINEDKPDLMLLYQSNDFAFLT